MDVHDYMSIRIIDQIVSIISIVLLHIRKKKNPNQYARIVVYSNELYIYMTYLSFKMSTY